MEGDDSQLLISSACQRYGTDPKGYLVAAVEAACFHFQCLRFEFLAVVALVVEDSALVDFWHIFQCAGPGEVRRGQRFAGYGFVR